MVYAYLDGGNDVVGISTTPVPIGVAQGKNPDIVARVDNAPRQLRPKILNDSRETFYHHKITGDGTDISHYEQVAVLDAYKQARYEEIDDKDVELIEQGFSHNGATFSLSSNAQKTWLMLHQMRAELPYPFLKSQLDDSVAPYSIADQIELETIATQILTKVGGIITSGDAIKTQIRAATTKAEIDAILDNR